MKISGRNINISNMDEKDELLELKYKACIMHVI